MTLALKASIQREGMRGKKTHSKIREEKGFAEGVPLPGRLKKRDENLKRLRGGEDQPRRLDAFILSFVKNLD